MNVEAKFAGVQLQCAGVQVKALFANYVKGCGFYVHVSECAPRFVVKKIGDGEEKYDNVRLVSVQVVGKKGKKLKI